MALMVPRALRLHRNAASPSTIHMRPHPLKDAIAVLFYLLRWLDGIWC
jgi:hypothetical protein